MSDITYGSSETKTPPPSSSLSVVEVGPIDDRWRTDICSRAYNNYIPKTCYYDIVWAFDATDCGGSYRS